MRLFPEQASTIAGRVDAVTLFVVGVSVFFTLLIVVAILYLVVRYRRSVSPRAAPTVTDMRLEAAWIVVPLVIVMAIFWWGARVYIDAYTPPADAIEVYGLGKQWMWTFQHPEGRREINDLHVPVGRPVRVILTSEDVIHSFFVPAFRVKMDVVPGRYTEAWFEATRVGSYHLFCAEYCGNEHARMIGRVHVLTEADYERWLADVEVAPDAPPVTQGERLFQTMGCVACHERDDAQGPSFVGLFGSERLLETGEVVVADEGYIRTQILRPGEMRLEGYPPIMPPFEGQLTETDLQHLIAYIKSLDGVEPTQPEEESGR